MRNEANSRPTDKVEFNQKVAEQLKAAVNTHDPYSSRVATDLENVVNLEKSGNLKETSESQGICLKSQGICDRIPKVREKSGNFVF